MLASVRLRRLGLVLGVTWCLVLTASLVVFWEAANKAALEHARVEARSAYEKDLLYRRWVSEQGGVYVSPSDTTPPNPYLTVPARDLETTDGRRLTLVNPAYMTRQVHELGRRSRSGMRGHITSLKPIRPGNAPDPWEREALQGFEHGNSEAVSEAVIDGAAFLRYMRPMMTEASCLKCHAQQGYRVGQVRGGLSVSVPLWPYRAVAARQERTATVAHLLLAFIGLAAIAATTRRLKRHVRDLERSQHALAESEEGYRRLVDMSPDAVFVHVDGRFVFLNPAGCALLGAERPETLIGRAVLESVHPEDREAVATRAREVSAERKTSPLAQVRFVRLDGDVVDVEAAGAPITFQGKPAVQVVARNITERLHLESQLRQSQKLEAVGQLAGGVAHDFNNILAASMMQLGLLQRRDSLDAETRAGLEDLSSGIERAANLTRQLLMFGRRSSRRVVPVDLNAVVEGLLKMLARLIGEHIDLRFEPTTPLPLIDADAGMMEQVLLNLAVNARDAMPRGGRLTIATSVTRVDGDDAGENGERREGDYVRLSVTDAGIGMDEAVLKRIFEPFFTTKEVGRGSGLGLATVYGIVKQHGGWVDVSSAVGQGTRFDIFFPVGTSQAAPSPPSDPEHPEVGHEGILVVEDEDAVRRLAARGLRAAGYTVFEARDGHEALALWETHARAIHLLFTDMVMPEAMTGLELARRLQSHHPGLRVLISSGYSTDLSDVHAPEASTVTYLPKPYQLSGLLRAVREALGGA